MCIRDSRYTVAACAVVGIAVVGNSVVIRAVVSISIIGPAVIAFSENIYRGRNAVGHRILLEIFHYGAQKIVAGQIGAAFYLSLIHI